jgi:hypothetical protein
MSQSPKQQQVQIRVDESKMTTAYANTIRTSTTADEIVLDFGINLPQQQGQDQPMTMVFAVGSRVVMNWTGAKRLTASLQQAVAAYEQRFGAIDMSPKQPIDAGQGPEQAG